MSLWLVTVQDCERDRISLTAYRRYTEQLGKNAALRQMFARVTVTKTTNTPTSFSSTFTMLVTVVSKTFDLILTITHFTAYQVVQT